MDRAGNLAQGSEEGEAISLASVHSTGGLNDCSRRIGLHGNLNATGSLHVFPR